MSEHAGAQRRVAIVSEAAGYVGPNLARVLVERCDDLVVGDPADRLVDELTATGAAIEVVERVRDLAKHDAAERLVQAAMDRFGRIDSATALTGRIVVGRFLRSTMDDLRAALVGCVEAQVPMGRLGTLDELAHFSAAFVDGTSRFATGQFVAFDGGWA